eukprot:3140368-Pyramimonas_sp.AAC.1
MPPSPPAARWSRSSRLASPPPPPAGAAHQRGSCPMWVGHADVSRSGFVDDDSSPVCVCPSPHKFPASPASVVRRIAFPTLESAQVRSGNSEECDQRPSHEICTSTNGARDFCVMCVCPRVER